MALNEALRGLASPWQFVGQVQGLPGARVKLRIKRLKARDPSLSPWIRVPSGDPSAGPRCG